LAEVNQAFLVRGGIMLLQYGFLALIYLFIYRIGTFMYRDMLVTYDPDSQVKQEMAIQSEEAYYLTVEEAGNSSGLTAGTRFILDPTTTIGRNPHNNVIVVQESFVSGEHALIQLYKHQYWISDLNSTNGTLVNGSRICDETLLASGDTIKIGSVALRFER
jgi:pSer/pThr/pTyr-binding forkhead associated (FHA) protein